jgi:hypothetical protein
LLAPGVSAVSPQNTNSCQAARRLDRMSAANIHSMTPPVGYRRQRIARPVFFWRLEKFLFQISKS